MYEAGLRLFQCLRQRQPHLYAFNRDAIVADVLGDPLRMCNATSCRHQVNGARLDALSYAETIPMHHRTGKKIGYCGEPDMRMGTDIAFCGPCFEGRGTHVVEKDEGADALPLRR